MKQTFPGNNMPLFTPMQNSIDMQFFNDTSRVTQKHINNKYMTEK